MERARPAATVQLIVGAIVRCELRLAVEARRGMARPAAALECNQNPKLVSTDIQWLPHGIQGGGATDFQWFSMALHWNPIDVNVFQ